MRCSYIQRRVREGSKCTSWPTFCVTWNSRTPSLIMSLRSRPHYAAEIWRRSFISSVRPTVHTSPSRKQSFPKTLFKPEEFENAGFWFSCGRKNVLKTELFENHDITMITWFRCASFPQTQIQNDRWLLHFKFLWRSVDGENLMRFQSENAVFNFLQRCVNGA